jgi:hypothetical protein
LAILIGIMFGVRYIISSDELTIKICHITHRKIPVDRILSIKRSFDPTSSPANALKRLSIKYKEGEILISPSNERSFIEHLLEINSNIKLINLGSDYG